MPVTSFTQKPDSLQLEIIADFPVPVTRLWNAYADPGQLERFWGPPDYPATFTRHELAVGGESSYYMTAPDGDRFGGYWRVSQAEPLHSFTVQDGFADQAGNPMKDMPVTETAYSFSTYEQGSRLTSTTTFDSRADMDKLIDMGMMEGTEQAMGQIDAVLAEPDPADPGSEIRLTVLDDTVVRFSRPLAGSVEDVWRALHDADILRRWQLGPDGWSLPVCEVAHGVGQTYRYLWEPDAGTPGEEYGPFGFTGTVLEYTEPHRVVNTEMMTDADGEPLKDSPETHNATTLTPVADGTLLTLVITYPDVPTRDSIIATGMADGMEMSYARLDRVLSSGSPTTGR